MTVATRACGQNRSHDECSLWCLRLCFLIRKKLQLLKCASCVSHVVQWKSIMCFETLKCLSKTLFLCKLNQAWIMLNLFKIYAQGFPTYCLCCEDGPSSGTCCPGVGRPGMPVLGPQLHRICAEEAGERSGENGWFQVGERARPWHVPPQRPLRAAHQASKEAGELHLHLEEGWQGSHSGQHEGAIWQAWACCGLLHPAYSQWLLGPLGQERRGWGSLS